MKIYLDIINHDLFSCIHADLQAESQPLGGPGVRRVKIDRHPGSFGWKLAEIGTFARPKTMKH